jgi:phosphonoacetate hydrolase
MDALARMGTSRETMAIVPTVTNVNHVSIVTGEYPEKHGITGNYYRNERGDGHYMESNEFLLAPTIFQRLGQWGERSALLTVKDKLRTLIGNGAALSLSAETPPSWLVDRIGPPPHVYSLEVNHWLLLALKQVLMSDKDLTFFYLTTSDYPQHKFSPEADQVQWFLSYFDKLLGDSLSECGEFDLVVTADHGMNAKTKALDSGKILQKHRIQAEMVPVIKDRYVEHHANLGGAAYLYLSRPEEAGEAIAVLRAHPGIDAVLTRKEAAELYHLHPDRIGDLTLLANAETVFGHLDAAEMETNVRSHGSLHERSVPLIASGKKASQLDFADNKDAIGWALTSGARRAC